MEKKICVVCYRAMLGAEGVPDDIIAKIKWKDKEK